jgi:hypothetical protein
MMNNTINLDGLTFFDQAWNIKFDKNGFPLDYHTIAGNRFQHLQDMLRLPDSGGKQYYMGTFSQNCSDDEGGMVFVGEVAPASHDGRVIWMDELNNRNQAGGFNHPGDMRRVGNIVVIAGQNWDGGSISKVSSAEDFFKTAFSKLGQAFADKMRMGNGGQAVLFYDVTNPAKPHYMGRLSSCWKGDQEIESEGDIDTITASKSGDYYYLAFNGSKGFKCRSKSLEPTVRWEFVEEGNDNGSSPVFFTSGGKEFAGGASLQNGKVVFDKLCFNNSGDYLLNGSSDQVCRTNVGGAVPIIGSSFGDGATFSLSTLPNGQCFVVYANVESDDYVEIEVISPRPNGG